MIRNSSNKARLLASLAAGVMLNPFPRTAAPLAMSRPMELLSEELKAKIKAGEERAAKEALAKARLKRERRLRKGKL